MQQAEVPIAMPTINNVQADCSQPLAMNGVSSYSPLHIPWLIDTEVTDHMIYKTSICSSITSSVSIVVKFPNGQIAPVSHIGTIYINPQLTLHNVLCVPHFILI